MGNWGHPVEHIIKNLSLFSGPRWPYCFGRTRCNVRNQSCPRSCRSVWQKIYLQWTSGTCGSSGTLPKTWRKARYQESWDGIHPVLVYRFGGWLVEKNVVLIIAWKVHSPSRARACLFWKLIVMCFIFDTRIIQCIDCRTLVGGNLFFQTSENL